MRHHVRAPTSTQRPQIRTNHKALLGNTGGNVYRRSHSHIHRMPPFQALLAGNPKSRYPPSSFLPEHSTNQGAGTCSKGIIQLEVFSVLNMATDLMLIALPLPHLIKIKRPLIERLRLIALFLVGITIIAVTMTRLLMNVVLFHRSGQSHNVANVEIFFAAFVANAPTIYGLLNIEGRKRGTARAQYLPDSYTGSKSGGGIGSNVSRNRGLDSSRYQPGDNLQSKAWSGKSRYDHDSDEEMMIVSLSPTHVLIIVHGAHLLTKHAGLGVGKCRETKYSRQYHNICRIAESESSLRTMAKR